MPLGNVSGRSRNGRDIVRIDYANSAEVIVGMIGHDIDWTKVPG